MSKAIAFFITLFMIVCDGQNVRNHARYGKLWELVSSNVAIPTPAMQFKQKYDHFNATNTDTFLQRYYVDDRFWTDKRGPILLYIGGESSLDHLPGGFVDELARRHQAKIVALEHRFYGQSIPKNDLSVENLKYLTAQQALADLAFFRTVYQQTLPWQHNAWISIGGSYPGALSAWFRLAYPTATVGALASSGVVNAIYEYTGFDEQIARSVGPACADVLRKTTSDMEAATNWAKHLFGADHLSDPDFYYMLADGAAMTVQYGHKDKLCGPMIAAANANESLIQAFANFIDNYYGPTFGSGCFYDTECLRSDPSRWANSRSWRWQKCSQLAFFQVAPTKVPIRSKIVNLDYHEAQCAQIFGEGLNTSQAVADINARFGGKAPKGRFIFFSNFADDPWQTASVINPISRDEPAMLANCDLCGHCADLSKTAPVPLELIQQREAIDRYLTKWLHNDPDPFLLNTNSLVGISETPHYARASIYVLFPLTMLLIVFKMVLHVDIVREAAYLGFRLPVTETIE